MNEEWKDFIQISSLKVVILTILHSFLSGRSQKEHTFFSVGSAAVTIITELFGSCTSQTVETAGKTYLVGCRLQRSSSGPAGL